VVVTSQVLRKVSLRLIPFILLCYVVSFLDRVNVGFAGLQMNQDLGLTATQFGFGSAIFFLGYCLFEVPSNVILARVGARRWIARIMISWGLLAAALVFTQGPISFSVLRFLLGAAEAGFFPGIIYFLTFWYPNAARARAIAAFMIGIPLSGVIGGPLSGALLGLDGSLGLSGWQWLYLVEGIPAVILGFIVLGYLTDQPKDARWLAPEERAALVEVMAADAAERGDAEKHRIRDALLNPSVWRLGAIPLLANTGYYGYIIWSPQLIKSFLNSSNWVVGLVSGTIAALMAISMLANGVHSDRTRERRLHVALPLFVMVVGFIASALLPSPTLSIGALALVPIGMGAFFAPFYSLSCGFLSGEAAAAGIALVVALANVGGLIGPYLIGFLKDATGGYVVPLLVLGGIVFLAAVLALRLPADRPIGDGVGESEAAAAR
jgi:ACS family tartrate transporter-like MFS transporter